MRKIRFSFLSVILDYKRYFKCVAEVPVKNYIEKAKVKQYTVGRGLTRAIYILHPLHRASENVASQRGIEPGTSCTAGKYFRKRAIQTAVFRCHSGSQLSCYNTIKIMGFLVFIPSL